MSFLSADWGDRRPLDYVFIAVAGATILTFAGIGSYGVTVGFLQTNAYFKANDIVSFGCGVIAAGCALYLLLELTTERRGQALLGICVACGMFGFFAVSKGVPAAVTMSVGHPGRVVYVVERYEYGGRGCSRRMIATNPAYEAFTLCTNNIRGPDPDIGRHVEVYGHVSNWGVTREDYRIL